MAIRPFGDDSPMIEPLCALKVGTFNCFCMWTPEGIDDPQTETQPANRTLPPAQEHARSLEDVENRNAHEESIEAGNDAAYGQSSRKHGQSSSSVQASLEPCAPIDHPLLSVIRFNLGPQSPLLQMLSKIGCVSDSRNIDAVVCEQARRVVTQHEEALVPSDMTASEWSVLELNKDDFGLNFGSRNVEDTIHWFRGMDFPVVDGPPLDMVKAFAAFLEVDLSVLFVEDLISGTPLGMHTAKRDAVWQTLMQGSNIKEDNIWVQCGIDALEEPARSLVVIAMTTQRPPGLLLVPPPTVGFHRAEFECTITRIQPLKLIDGRDGFRVSQTGVSRPCGPRRSPPGMSMLNVEEASRKTSMFFTKFRQCLERTNRLNERLKLSPRTPLYDRVNKHLCHMRIIKEDDVSKMSHA